MKQFSEETRRKMSESAKRRCQNPEWIAAQKLRGTNLDIDEVKRLYYDEKMSQVEVAKALGVTQKVVHNFMKRHGLKARNSAKRNQWRENNSNWKGGRYIDEHGYVEVYQPGNAHARSAGYVREHILVAEKMLGRSLVYYGQYDQRNEEVHHINGNKQDNRPENLLVVTASEHRKIHHSVAKEMVDEVLLERIRTLENELRQTYELIFGDEDAGIEGDIKEYL